MKLHHCSKQKVSFCRAISLMHWTLLLLSAVMGTTWLRLENQNFRTNIKEASWWFIGNFLLANADTEVPPRPEYMLILVRLWLALFFNIKSGKLGMQAHQLVLTYWVSRWSEKETSDRFSQMFEPQRTQGWSLLCSKSETSRCIRMVNAVSTN